MKWLKHMQPKLMCLLISHKSTLIQFSSCQHELLFAEIEYMQKRVSPYPTVIYL